MNADAVGEWCARELGSEVAETLFARGNLSAVHGVRLADGREVVIKVRPAAARYAGCTAVQRELWRAGFPCPEPLVGPLPLHPGEGGDGFAVNAEALITGGTPFDFGGGGDGGDGGGDGNSDDGGSGGGGSDDGGSDRGGDGAAAFAGLLARLISLAPKPADVPDLSPSPAWIAWDHGHRGVWPPPDDRDIDLNALPETAWLDRLGAAARDRLAAAGTDAPVIGHCDWESHNLDFRDGEPFVVHDWDSVVAAPETVIVGVAAAMWPAGIGCVGASVQQTTDFLTGYQEARGRKLTAEEIEQTWAAGLWIRSFNAKKFLLDGFDTLSADEAEERRRRAGACT
jgi:hypothetical protein